MISVFCDLYGEWNRANKLTLRQQHTPGEKLFIITDLTRMHHVRVDRHAVLG